MDITNTAPTPHRVICSWCTPKPELDALNRQFPGQISHGLCQPCAARLLADDKPAVSDVERCIENAQRGARVAA